MATRNGERGNVGIIWKTFHPVFGMHGQGQSQKRSKSEDFFFHDVIDDELFVAKGLEPILEIVNYEFLP